MKVNKSYSGFSEISSGVPQRSIQGPLLFNMYISDVLRDLLPFVQFKKREETFMEE